MQVWVPHGCLHLHQDDAQEGAQQPGRHPGQRSQHLGLYREGPLGMPSGSLGRGRLRDTRDRTGPVTGPRVRLPTPVSQ